MKRITKSIFGIGLIMLILLPLLSAHASMVPKNLYAPSKEMAKAAGKPDKLPISEIAFTGEGTVVAFKAEPWAGEAICVAQIQQADGKAFNAYVPAEDIPLIRIRQGNVICHILQDAKRSGRKVRVEGMIFEHGGAASLGKMRVQHIRYFKNPVGMESPDLSMEEHGDSYGCMGYCTVIGYVISVDANVHRWKEWEFDDQKQAMMCRAAFVIPEEEQKIIRLDVGSWTDFDELEKDDPGKFWELGADPIGVEEDLASDVINCVSTLVWGIKEEFVDLMEDIDEDEAFYVSRAKSRTREEAVCEALADALSSGQMVALYGDTTALGRLSAVYYVIRYPEGFEFGDQYVFDGYMEESGEDNDWAVGPSAF